MTKKTRRCPLPPRSETEKRFAEEMERQEREDAEALIRAARRQFQQRGQHP